jgi:hypothetical protein
LPPPSPVPLQLFEKVLVGVPTSADDDGDGVVDTIDVGNGAFDDHAGTTGTIVDWAGLTVSVADATYPDGVRVTTGPGTGHATLATCAGFPVEVAAGSEVVITCGSVTVHVFTGAATVVLGGGTTVVSVPAGAVAKVSDAGGGAYRVDNLGTVAVTVTVDGLFSTVGAGSTSTVKTWHFAGFSTPVDNAPVVNVGKAGRGVPLRWRLLDSTGRPVTNLATARLTVTSLSCATGTSVDQLEESTAGASGLLNLGNGSYQINWLTPSSYAQSCKTLHLDLGEGVTRNALFRFER